MITDLIAGRLSFSFDTLPQNVPHIKAEKLRPLAVTSRTRSHVAPDIPTVIEAGMPYLLAENFIGVSAPANLPPAVLTKLHAAIQTSLDDPQLVGAAERPRLDGAQDVPGRVRRLRAAAGAGLGRAGQGIRRKAQLTRAIGAKTRTPRHPMHIRNPRDFWAGAIYLVLAIVVHLDRPQLPATAPARGWGRVFPNRARLDPRALRRCVDRPIVHPPG